MIETAVTDKTCFLISASGCSTANVLLLYLDGRGNLEEVVACLRCCSQRRSNPSNAVSSDNESCIRTRLLNLSSFRYKHCRSATQSPAYCRCQPGCLLFPWLHAYTVAVPQECTSSSTCLKHTVLPIAAHRIAYITISGSNKCVFE